MATKTELEQAKFEAWVASDKSITAAELALWLRKDSAGRYFSITAKAGWAAWQASRITIVNQIVDEICDVYKAGGSNVQEAAIGIGKKIKELL